MKKMSMIFGIIGSLMVLLTFLLPIWSITLEAPQYPDGISMYIWINKMTGETESTLQNVNILNHYVGMKFIVPDSIPELKYFPFVIIGMSLLGIIFSILNKSKYYLIWIISLILLGIAGMYDFYLWEYDYGHNLNPKAPIKIPGQSYQPPLIGSEMLLNFKATSLPDTGSMALGVALFFHFCAFVISYKSNKIEKLTLKFESKIVPIVLMVFGFVALLSSCNVEPVEINYGKDECTYCKMTIMDEKFGAELVSTKGKVFKFDAIECMFDYIYESSVKRPKYAYYLVNRFNEPRKLNDAYKTFFLICPKIPSPMGGNLSGYANYNEANKAIVNNEGKIYNWTEINNFFKERYDKFK